MGKSKRYLELSIETGNRGDGNTEWLQGRLKLSFRATANFCPRFAGGGLLTFQ